MSTFGEKLRLREHIMALQGMADTAALARAGTAVPSLEDLAACCPFFGDDVVNDAQKSASDLLAELAEMAQEYGEMYAPAPARIQAAMRAYADRPTPELAHGLRDLVLKWRAGFKATSTHHWLHGYLNRIDFHLQEWGDRAAATRVAAYVAAHALRLGCTPRLLHALGVVHESLMPKSDVRDVAIEVSDHDSQHVLTVTVTMRTERVQPEPA